MGDVVRREGADGARLYVRFVDHDGVRRMRRVPSTGEGIRADERAARRMLAAAETRVANGSVGIVEPTALERGRATITINELADKFLTDYAPASLKDVKEYRVQARSLLKKRIRPHLGHMAAAAVRPLHVEQLQATLRADGYKPNTIHDTLRILSRLYAWGAQAGALGCANPVSRIGRPRRDRSIDYFDQAEVGRLLAHAEAEAPELYPMIATGIFAGLRKGELFGLRWSDVHLEAARLDVFRSYRSTPKSGKARHLPMHPELVAILRAWQPRCPATEERLVFPVCIGGAWRMGARDDMRGIECVLTAAGCHQPAKPWHALRHTFASHYMMSRGNILALQKLLGHATLEMTLIYAHLAPDFMADEVAHLAFPRPSLPKVTDLAAARTKRARGDA